MSLSEFSVDDADAYRLVGVVGASHQAGARQRHVVVDAGGRGAARRRGVGDGHQHHLVPVGVIGFPVGVALHALRAHLPERCDKR